VVFTVEDTESVAREDLSVSIPVSINSVNAAATGVPEPGTFAMLGVALATLGSLAWRRTRVASFARQS
jgi:hypothetical protein